MRLYAIGATLLPQIGLGAIDTRFPELSGKRQSLGPMSSTVAETPTDSMKRRSFARADPSITAV